MGGLLTELSKKLAERWLSLLVLPGALYLAALATAHDLGQAFDLSQLTHQIDKWATAPTLRTPGGLAVSLLALLLASAAAGLAAQAAGSVTEHFWLATDWTAWPPPLRQIAHYCVNRRQRRWTEASTAYQQQLERAGRARAHRLNGHPADTPPTAPTERSTAHRKMTRIAPEHPTRPTWIGDRLNAVTIRLDREYQLDLATVWPHLWLTLPDTIRNEITAARESLTRATTLAGWGLLYLATAILWWPGLIIAMVVIGTARYRARTATDTYALLLEAASRLHTADLARQLGIEHTGILDPKTGWTLTCLLQGKPHLIALTAAETPASPGLDTTGLPD